MLRVRVTPGSPLRRFRSGNRHSAPLGLGGPDARGKIQTGRHARQSSARSACARTDVPRADSGWMDANDRQRSEEHTSELQSLMRISYAVFCLKKKKPKDN